jgi:hypothetical protein
VTWCSGSVLQHGRIAVVVLRRADDESIGFPDLIAPTHDLGIRVVVPRDIGRQRFLEKRQRIISQVEELNL